MYKGNTLITITSSNTHELKNSETNREKEKLSEVGYEMYDSTKDKINLDINPRSVVSAHGGRNFDHSKDTSDAVETK